MSQGFASGLVTTDISPFIQDLDDPLTSLSTMTTYSGTWSIDTYLKVIVATSTQCRARSNTPVSTMTKNVVEMEAEVPSSYGTGTTTHWRVGINTGDVAGAMSFGIRGDGNAYFEVDATAVGATAAYTIPSAGTWVKIRMVNSGDRFTGYLDGVKAVETRHSPVTMHGANWYPYIVVYSVPALTIRLRNLRAWSWGVLP